jgi:hypothetical protein
MYIWTKDKRYQTHRGYSKIEEKNRQDIARDSKRKRNHTRIFKERILDFQKEIRAFQRTFYFPEPDDDDDVVD